MRTTFYTSTGLTLIELMIAMLLSLSLLSLLMSIYLATEKSHTLQINLIDSENSARLALNQLYDDLQYAGYIGCAYLTDDFPITAYPPFSVTPQNKIVWQNGTIIVRHAGLKNAVLINSMNNYSILHASKKPQFDRDNILIITDCKKAEIFAVKKVLYSKFEQIIIPVSPLHEKFDRFAEISHLEINTYFIGKNQSLYFKKLRGLPIELAQGINNMNVNMTENGVAIALTQNNGGLQQTWHLYAPFSMKSI